MADGDAEGGWKVVGSYSRDGGTWARELAAGWVLTATVARSPQDRPVLAALGITRAEGEAPTETLGTDLWRSVQVGSVLPALSRYLAEADELAEEDDWLKAFETDWTPRGRAGHSDLSYALLAHAYAVLLRNGVRSPKKRLAEIMNCPAATVNTRLVEARKRGLLTTSGSPGVAGGELTTRGRHLLAHRGDAESSEA